MPQAVGLAFAKIFTVAFVKQLAITIAVNVLLAKVSKALAPKQKGPGRVPVPVEYSGTLESRRILYGQNKVSGMNVIPPIVTGTTGDQLHQVLAIAGTEINSIGTVYFNEIQITSGQLDGAGNVTSGPFANRANITKYTGTATQAVDDVLASAATEWTTTHRGRGIAYIALRYRYDTNVYKNGKPEVSCIAQGRKVYDPRLDTSPGANPTNLSYIAYRTNPALCLADYLTLDIGLGESAGRIDWALVVAAANICDESVSIPSASQPRYTCNTLLTNLEEFETNIEILAKAMNGACYYSGGRWRMFAGAWTTNAFALTEDDLSGSVNISTAYSRKSGNYYNHVTGYYVDPNRNYQPSSFSPVFNAAYETDDGERIPADVELLACNNEYEAQRYAILYSRQSRRQRVVTAQFSLSAYKVRPYETGTITLAEAGWTNQQVRCIGWRFRPDPSIELTLIEAGSSDFANPTTGEYNAPGSVTPPGSAEYKPGPPLNFTATGLASGILFRWQRPQNAPVGVLFELYEHTSNTPFSSASAVATDIPDTQFLLPKNDTTERYYWVRAKIPSTAAVGATEPASLGLPGKASSTSGALGATVSPGTASSSGVGSSLTTGTVTASPYGGTAPYTYACAFTAGGTGITINNGTTASPSFSATGLTVGETRSGTATITVTDNVSATTTVSVAVTITRLSGISLSNKNVSNAFFVPGSADAIYSLLSSRAVSISPGSTSDQWGDAGITASDFQARATVVSGGLSSGTTGSWLGLGTNRTWTLTGTTSGEVACQLTIEIRDVATSTVQATCTVNLSVTGIEF